MRPQLNDLADVCAESKSRFSADSVRNPVCFKSADLYFFPDIEKNESAGNLCVTFHALTAEMQIDFSV